MRYTEARLAKDLDVPAGQDIDRDTVDFQPNYDEKDNEPKVLPAALPEPADQRQRNGIAVGMATNIPPHNPTENLRRRPSRCMANPDITPR